MRMKPTFSDACRDGRWMLCFQLDGLERELLKDILVGNCIVAHALHHEHSLTSAWQRRFVFEDGAVLEFSSAMTVVTGWQEIGNLNLKVTDTTNDLNGHVFREFSVGRFHIAAVECLVYEDPDVYSECGIVFRDLSGSEWVIAAGISPGAVSIGTPFADETFSPEFSVTDYRRAGI
jgi:hypothetical protein